MARTRTGRGFTLIELLVVVSIITLLISILLPAVGAARTRARVSADVQNMKQHGIGMANYAAANGDTLPNAPIAPPDDKPKPTAGVPGRTARMFGTTEFPVNGFAFQSNGVPTWSPPLDFGNDAMLNNSSSWSHMAMCYNGYFVVMSQYMTDKEGIDALQDVFYSPADTRGKQIRDTMSRPFLQGNKGAWPGLSSARMEENFRTPSYRYVPAGVVSPAVMDVTLRGDPSGSDLDLTSNSRDISGENYRENGFYSYVKRNPSASVDYPSQKVMYFLEEALHNPNRLSWFEPGAICPVAMADGSARETVPDRDAIDGRNEAAVAERAGSWETVRYKYTPGAGSQPPVEVSYYMPYVVTRGGIRGRDL
jgi:prepilin-type N-terminal cleavage/methylation domain-containing protein